VRRALAISLLAVAPVLAACGSSKHSTSTPAQAPPPASAKTTPTKPTPGAGGCLDVQQPSPRNPGTQKKPTAPLATGKSWSLVVKTSCGSFTIALDLKTAPHAAASMVALARGGFFKNTTFHRVVTGFVIQGGDPTATGAGGPGYTTVDKPPASASYPPGVVAMAKTQTDPPGTAGSQFFVVTGTASSLTPDYAVLGKVTSGMAVVERIGKLGNGDGPPTQPVVIDDIKVSSK
jgi:peptidyl-prolyl cis-trans isomerase B (cyclophilin B)